MRNKLQTCLRRILLGGSAMVLATGALATAADLTIQRHETAGIVDLVPGADRGTITQPLLIGTIASTGQQVLFVITDASDANFAEMFGAIRADGLTQAPEEAVE